MRALFLKHHGDDNMLVWKLNICKKKWESRNNIFGEFSGSYKLCEKEIRNICTEFRTVKM